MRFGPLQLGELLLRFVQIFIARDDDLRFGGLLLRFQLLLRLLLRDSLLLRHLTGTRKFLQQLLGRHRERGIALQAFIQRLVVDRFRMKLLLDPLFRDRSGGFVRHHPDAGRTPNGSARERLLHLR